MSAYFLVIDTETSGLPKNWQSPYAQIENWPFAVQVAWVVYSADGSLVKQENHYIKNTEGPVEASAQRIHGITPEFLEEKGIERCVVLQSLVRDLAEFHPILLGHFAEFDLHIIGADSFRCGIENPVLGLPYFCTMTHSAHLVRNPNQHLRLVDLYSFLFHKAIRHPHHALYDALATGECFFELIRRGDIRKSDLENKLNLFKGPQPKHNGRGCAFFWLLFSVLTIAGLMMIYGF